MSKKFCVATIQEIWYEVEANSMEEAKAIIQDPIKSPVVEPNCISWGLKIDDKYSEEILDE